MSVALCYQSKREIRYVLIYPFFKFCAGKTLPEKLKRAEKLLGTTSGELKEICDMCAGFQYYMFMRL